MRIIFFAFTLIIGLLALAGMIFVPSAFAANQTQEITVDQGVTGGYQTISAALANITDASSTKRYRITVKPGTYNETVTMKEYVDLVGSGQNNTIVTSTASTSGNPYSGTAPSTATIVAKSNSTLSHLTAINNSTSSDSHIAVLFVNTTMSEEDVPSAQHITAKTTGSNSGYNYSISVYGSSAYVTLDHVTAHTEGSSNENLGITSNWGAYTKINNARATAKGGGWASAITSYGAFADVRNSVAMVDGGSYIEAVDCTGGSDEAFFANSSLIAKNGTNTTNGSFLCTVVNSEIRATSSQGYVNAVEGGKVASSLLEGSLSSSPTVVNCWDETFTAITNQ